MIKSFTNLFFDGIALISKRINIEEINNLIIAIKKIKNEKGRIFFLGLGGSAANCIHAINDFRKLCEIECYSPVENVSELTARINDDGWITPFKKWLEVSNLKKRDALFIFSVGGGDLKKKVSLNLIEAAKFAKKKKTKIFSILGREKSYIAKLSDNSIIIPNISKQLLTPYAESFQAIIWHSIVSNPLLKVRKTKW